MNVIKLRENEMPLACGEQAELMPELPSSLQAVLDTNLDAIPESRWGEVLRALVGKQEATFMRMGYAKVDALRLARASVLTLAEYSGGRQVYLPRGDTLKVTIRDIEIYRRAKRGNIEELADEYGLTTRSVWRIVRDQHRLHVRKIQGALSFAPEEKQAAQA